MTPPTLEMVIAKLDEVVSCGCCDDVLFHAQRDAIALLNGQAATIERLTTLLDEARKDIDYTLSELLPDSLEVVLAKTKLVILLAQISPELNPKDTPND